MLVWLIPDRLAKGGFVDVVDMARPEYLVVAAEHPDHDFSLFDEPIDSMEQRMSLSAAVSYALESLTMGSPLVIICQQGRSRAVTVACLAAALWEQTSFDAQFYKVLRQEPTIVRPSPLRALAEKMYPQLFTYRQENTTLRDMVLHARRVVESAYPDQDNPHWQRIGADLLSQLRGALFDLAGQSDIYPGAAWQVTTGSLSRIEAAKVMV